MSWMILTQCEIDISGWGAIYRKRQMTKMKPPTREEGSLYAERIAVSYSYQVLLPISARPEKRSENKVLTLSDNVSHKISCFGHTAFKFNFTGTLHCKLCAQMYIHMSMRASQRRYLSRPITDLCLLQS